jgi:predicted lipoprotein with Yx(FWY)xxD motif
MGRVVRTRRRAWHAAILAAAVGVGAMAVAGCGSGAPGSAPAYWIQARSVDGAGFTLYMYAPDHQGTPKCTGFCAQQWPPLLLPPGIGRPTAGRGVVTSLLGAVRRPDGRLQATYDGWPLYLWIGDTTPGQATGQADDMGLWYAVSVTGAVDKGTPR